MAKNIANDAANAASYVTALGYAEVKTLAPHHRKQLEEAIRAIWVGERTALEAEALQILARVEGAR